MCTSALAPTLTDSALSVCASQIVECIKHLREHPEPDGIQIFDIPIYPAMFRSMKCHGYVITFRMENREALVYAIVEDG